MQPYMSDRMRMELALPPALLRRCCRKLFSDHVPEEDRRERQALLATLDQAISDAVGSLPAGRQEQLRRRLDRAIGDLLRPFEDRPLIDVFLTVFFWLRRLIEAGAINLIAGSSGAKALDALIEALANEEQIWINAEQNALVAAVEFGGRVRALGYFQDITP